MSRQAFSPHLSPYGDIVEEFYHEFALLAELDTHGLTKEVRRDAGLIETAALSSAHLAGDCKVQLG